MSNPDPVSIQVTPEPTPVEMAAILAAYQGLYPEPVQVEKAAPQSNRWRFSGRWWAEAELRTS